MRNAVHGSVSPRDRYVPKISSAPRHISASAPAYAPSGGLAHAPPKAAPRLRIAADFERNLEAMARGMGRSVSLAAKSYMDIAYATEARGLVRKPTPWQRCRRHVLALARPTRAGTRDRLERCFSEGLRCGAEAMLRYYGVAPQSVGLPTPAAALRTDACTVSEQVVAALHAARATMAHLEMPHTRDLPTAQLPGSACRASVDKDSRTLTVFIAWFNGPDERSGLHHSVPLLAASCRTRRHFDFVSNAVNDLPTTFAGRAAL